MAKRIRAQSWRQERRARKRHNHYLRKYGYISEWALESARWKLRRESAAARD